MEPDQGQAPPRLTSSYNIPITTLGLGCVAYNIIILEYPTLHCNVNVSEVLLVEHWISESLLSNPKWCLFEYGVWYLCPRASLSEGLVHEDLASYRYSFSTTLANLSHQSSVNGVPYDT